MKLLLQTAAWHAHAGCGCVHGGSRIDPDVNGRQKAFQRVHDLEVRKDHLLVGVGGRSLRHCA